MSTTRPTGPIDEIRHAWSRLQDRERVLTAIAREANAIVPAGFALAFTCATPGAPDRAAAFRSGGKRAAMNRPARPPWVVDVARVPLEQRNVWFEPIQEGVHGQEFFGPANPLTRALAIDGPIDYGRCMVCNGERLVAWMGVYVPVRSGFTRQQRAQLMSLFAEMTPVLSASTRLDDDKPRRGLAPQKQRIVERVAKGWTNNQIAVALDVAPSTVKTTLERLYRESGARNRAALVDWWLGRG